MALSRKARRIAICAVVAAAAGCNSSIYVRDGVTDGDTFYLPEFVVYDDDPVLHAWVAYSLDLSACQLEIGGPNPARNSSYACEHGARRSLLESWYERRIENPTVGDPYLDGLAEIDRAGYLPEYVAESYGRSDWQLPDGLRRTEYRRWKRDAIPAHRAERRIVGSWNYRDRVASRGNDPG